MQHKVAAIQALPDYWLLAAFQNGEKRRYDMKPLIRAREEFTPLEYIPGLFGLVRVDAGGYGICWNEDIDLHCEDLYEDGLPVDATKTVV